VGWHPGRPESSAGKGVDGFREGRAGAERGTADVVAREVSTKPRWNYKAGGF